MRKFYKNFKKETEDSPAVMIVFMACFIGLAWKDAIAGIYTAIPAGIFAAIILLSSILIYRRKYNEKTTSTGKGIKGK